MLFLCFLKEAGARTFLAFQWLRIQASSAGGMCLIPSLRTKILSEMKPKTDKTGHYLGKSLDEFTL